MAVKSVKSARKARQDLRRIRLCEKCSCPVSLISAEDRTTAVKRTVVIEPTPHPEGWLVINDALGAFMDDEFTIEGERYLRHICPVRKYEAALTNHDPERVA